MYRYLQSWDLQKHKSWQKQQQKTTKSNDKLNDSVNKDEVTE